MADGDAYLTLHQGATFQAVFVWQDPNGVPIPLTGLSARLQARRGSQVLLDLGVGSGLTLEPAGATGEIHVRIGATVTAGLAQSGTYELEVFDPLDTDEVHRLVKGRLLVDPQVAA